MKNQLWALAGFLGLNSDWDIFKFNHLQVINPVNLNWQSLTEWAQKFNQRVQAQQSKKSILMGYSLGGRLALHALIHTPSLWRAAVIISAHPGLESQVEKTTRLEADEKWAVRFEQEEWSSVITDWNNQAVFANSSFQFSRNEADYNRLHLAHLLRQASLGRQEDLRHKIHGLNLPILWITGEKDKKYCQLAASLKFSHPLSKTIVLPDSGHRLPWEQPVAFKQVLQDFITQTKTKS